MENMGQRRAAWGAIGLLLGAISGCGKWVDNLACQDGDCFWTRDEWARVESLTVKDGTGMPDPPLDPSNKYLPLDAKGELTPVAKLGWLLYYEPRLSGTATWKDALGRDTATARACFGKPINVSCATCHDPQHAGGDVTSNPRHITVGAGWYDVNGQQTLNVAHYWELPAPGSTVPPAPTLYWNGRADSLWEQAAQVIESPVSMNGKRADIVAFMTADENYRRKYNEAFPDIQLDPVKGVVNSSGDPPVNETDPKLRVFVNLAKAIAAYEWLLSSDDSDFDRFVRAGPGSGVLSPAAQRGLKLFVGRASCVDCHRTSLFSDRKFHNIGVPQTGDGVPTPATCGTPRCDCAEPPRGADGGESDADGGGSDADSQSYSCYPWGWYTGVARLKFKARTDDPSRASTTAIDYRRDGPYSDISDEDKKKETLRYNDADHSQSVDKKGKWRTPSLRDVALTPPYMHDGVFASLADVVWHYDQGFPASGIGDAAPELKPLRLSDRDRGDLVAFLQSLTGRPNGKRNVAHRPDFDADGGAPPDASPSPGGPPAGGTCPPPAVPIPDAGTGVDGGT
jgi:cytochrome c peroxidase